MNFRLLSRLLGIISLLIGGAMIFSLPWTFPSLGYRNDGPATIGFELHGFLGMMGSVLICGIVGGILLYCGRGSTGRLYRKEAMAVVGLSWVLATILGALPFCLCGVSRCQALRLGEEDQRPLVAQAHWFNQGWLSVSKLDRPTYDVIAALANEKSLGLSPQELIETTGNSQATELIDSLLTTNPAWENAILVPDKEGDRKVAGSENYRVRYVPMGIADALFESQSGFSTTGATVIAELEDPRLVPHCILFWRSSTHFLGGLGIIVLFVVILGQGSAGKALMRAEMPGPTKEGSTARMQHTAWLFAAMYCALNAILAVIMWLQGMSVFDALCHAFGTMATGGFSTYNSSLGHFDSAAIDYVVILFMILAGSNFTLLYLVLQRKPGKLFKDVEWRVYMLIILLVTVFIIGFGMANGDFGSADDTIGQNFTAALRFGLFQVVSVITTTGYGTNDFDQWNHASRVVMFVLMFVGGCAGSTGGGMKVIRHILFVKILRLEIERSFHPTVVRPLRLGGKPLDDQDLKKNILIYFCLILAIFVGSWLFIVTVESDVIWGNDLDNKLVDSASAVTATLNNIGPGLGTVGATQNYSHFSPICKLLFVWLMMLGRLELFSILILCSPTFWRTR